MKLPSSNLLSMFIYLLASQWVVFLIYTTPNLSYYHDLSTKTLMLIPFFENSARVLIGFNFSSLLPSSLIWIGLFGYVTSIRSYLQAFINIELILLGINLLFIKASSFHQTNLGYEMVLWSISTAAAEVAIGLSILVVLENRKSMFVLIKNHRELKG